MSTLTTLLRATFAEADEGLQRANADTLLAQHLRDARVELAAWKGRLAQLIAIQTRDRRNCVALEVRITECRARRALALAAGQDDLANAVADEIVRLQDRVEKHGEEGSQLAGRIVSARLQLAEAERLLAELTDQLHLSRTRSTPSPRREFALDRAEAAARLLAERDQSDADLNDAYRQLQADDPEQSLKARLDASGLFDNRPERRNALITELRSELEGEPK